MKMIENIKVGFLKKKSKNSSKKDRQVLIKNMEQFLEVLIISNEENESFFKSAETVFLNAELKAIFLRKQKEDKTGQFRYSVHQSDFNLTGALKNDKLTKLIHTKFDLVVDLSNDSELLNYVLHNIDSTLIIGKLGSRNENLHDLFLEFGLNEESFLKNINNQLNHLNHGKQ